MFFINFLSKLKVTLATFGIALITLSLVDGTNQQHSEQRQQQPLSNSVNIFGNQNIDTQQKGAFDAIQEQISALHTGDLSRAYYTYTTKEFRQITSLESFKRFVKNFALLSRVKNFQVNQNNFNNNFGTIQGTLTSLDGEALGIEYEVTKEDGEWKIMGIQLFKAASNIEGQNASSHAVPTNTNPTSDATPNPSSPNKPNNIPSNNNEDNGPNSTQKQPSLNATINQD